VGCEPLLSDLKHPQASHPQAISGFEPRISVSQRLREQNYNIMTVEKYGILGKDPAHVGELERNLTSALFGGEFSLMLYDLCYRQWEHLSQMTMIPPMVPASMMSQAAAGMRLPFFGQNFQQRFSLPTDLIKQEPPRDSGNEEAMREYPSKVRPTPASSAFFPLH